VFFGVFILFSDTQFGRYGFLNRVTVLNCAELRQ
jgi:hypothetical protein